MTIRKVFYRLLTDLSMDNSLKNGRFLKNGSPDYFLPRGLAPSSPLSFCQSFSCSFLQARENSNTPAQRAELDWLLYHKPLEYAQMVLSGKIEHYLSLGCDHGRPKD